MFTGKFKYQREFSFSNFRNSNKWHPNVNHKLLLPKSNSSLQWHLIASGIFMSLLYWFNQTKDPLQKDITSFGNSISENPYAPISLRNKKVKTQSSFPDNDGLNVHYVNQSELFYYNNLSNLPLSYDIGKGICGGLSTIHIVRQLSSNNVQNPFEDRKAIEQAIYIQNNCHHEATCFAHIIAADCPETNLKKFFPQSKNIPGYTMLPISTSLESKLKAKIDATDADGIGRGMLIGSRSSSVHAISMTIQKRNQDLFCTGMDSNNFFAEGKGRSACDKIAKKMDDTMEDFRASGVVIHIAKKNISSAR